MAAQGAGIGQQERTKGTQQLWDFANSSQVGGNTPPPSILDLRLYGTITEVKMSSVESKGTQVDRDMNCEWTRDIACSATAALQISSIGFVCKMKMKRESHSSTNVPATLYKHNRVKVSRLLLVVGTHPRGMISVQTRAHLGEEQSKCTKSSRNPWPPYKEVIHQSVCAFNLEQIDICCFHYTQAFFMSLDANIFARASL